MTALTLNEEGIFAGGVQIACTQADAVQRLREHLGPQHDERPIGVAGSGRTGHWLSSGVIVVSQSGGSELVSVYVCFETSFAPFANVALLATPFVGSVQVATATFRGGESESAVRCFPEMGGFAGELSWRRGALFVGFSLERRVARFGNKTGGRRLVQISAEWGGLKPFPKVKRPVA
jgi:hypothetical protein